MKSGSDADARAAGKPAASESLVSPRGEPTRGLPSREASELALGPPPLTPFGLRLHHDGRWSHEGQPILNRGLREHFDKSVRYLPDEQKYVVTLRHFRGEIEVEEAAFFVRAFDAASGRVALSDRSEEALEPASLTLSPIDGALLCRVKRPLAPEGLLARFGQNAHAELLQAVEEQGERLVLRSAGALWPLPVLAAR